MQWPNVIIELLLERPEIILYAGVKMNIQCYPIEFKGNKTKRRWPHHPLFNFCGDRHPSFGPITIIYLCEVKVRKLLLFICAINKFFDPIKNIFETPWHHFKFFWNYDFNLLGLISRSLPCFISLKTSIHGRLPNPGASSVPAPQFLPIGLWANSCGGSPIPEMA